MIQIPCHHCGGSGVEKLPDHLQQTLALIPKKRSVTAQKLSELHPGFWTTAFNNRLENLRTMGFVKREKRGRSWLYTRIK